METLLSPMFARFLHGENLFLYNVACRARIRDLCVMVVMQNRLSI